LTKIAIKTLGETDFAQVCAQMQDFTAQREASTVDQLWLTTHPPVYSLGLNRKSVALPLRDDIPLVECDRGGKITYHGPGQLIIYGLIDLSRYGFSIRDWVSCLEQSVIDLLNSHGIEASAKKSAPGVYVGGAKIASLGLRMKKHYCYHGLSLNVDMDLSPFDAIDPCGYANQPVTQLADLGIQMPMTTIADALVSRLTQTLCEASEKSMLK